MVSVITLIVSCVVVCCVLKRKRQMMERARLMRQLHPGSDGIGVIGLSGDSDYGLHHHLMCPPSYDDTMMFSNEGFASRDQRTFHQPPPYSAVQKPDEQVTSSSQPPVYSCAIGQSSDISVTSVGVNDPPGLSDIGTAFGQHQEADHVSAVQTSNLNAQPADTSLNDIVDTANPNDE